MRMRTMMIATALAACVPTLYLPRWRLCAREIAGLSRMEREALEIAEFWDGQAAEAQPEDAGWMEAEARECRDLAVVMVEGQKAWWWAQRFPCGPRPDIDCGPEK